MLKPITSFFDFFLPRKCSCCEKVLSITEEIICSSCTRNLVYADATFIKKEFKRNFSSLGYIKSFNSLYLFEKENIIQKLFHNLKYNKQFRVGVFLGNQIAEKFSSTICKWEIDIIIPIPLHRLRRIERGYNQSYYIAKGIAANFNTKLKPKLLKRSRITSSQTKLSKVERRANIKGAFSVTNPKQLNGKNILLVDDVITTGSTVSECAKILKENGAKNVFAVSAAIAKI